MRRACMYVVLVALAAVGLPATAQAAVVTGVKAAIVPIPGFPETGAILGAGADVEIEGKLEGDELPGGLPLQTRRLVLYFPAGTKIDPTGFPTCTVAKLEEVGPEGCPKQSRIADGTVGVADQIGSGEATREEGALEIFITPGNGVVAYANAASPISAGAPRWMKPTAFCARRSSPSSVPRSSAPRRFVREPSGRLFHAGRHGY